MKQLTYVSAIALVATLHTAPAVAQAEGAAKSADIDSGDIIVTAQRRSEKLRDVPLSVSAFTGEQLAQAGIRDTVALTSTTPGLLIDRTGPFVLHAGGGHRPQVPRAGRAGNRRGGKK